MEARDGSGREPDPKEEAVGTPEPPEELEDLDPDDLPRVLNAEKLDRVSLGLDQLLALRFSGGGITRRGVSLRLAGELFQDLYRYFAGAQPVAAGMDVALQGSPPRLPGISLPMLQGATTGRSITVVLGLAGIEARKLREVSPRDNKRAFEELARFPSESEAPNELAAEFPTLAATAWLTDLLSAEPERAARQVKSLGRRTTRDFLKLVEHIAAHELETDLRSRSQSVAVPSGLAFATADTLKKTEEQEISRFAVSGALYQADARNDRFRLITEEGKVYKGTYIAGMTSLIRDAWAKLVQAKLVQIDYRWIGADEPHRTLYELESIDKVLGDADELLAEHPPDR
ncbi:MAG: hypothetical protein M3Y75_11095 [Actinomycetota bacterium]|nr:hypothetical protein [Actinomycetota bacterium]